MLSNSKNELTPRTLEHDSSMNVVEQITLFLLLFHRREMQLLQLNKGHSTYTLTLPHNHRH